MGNNGFKRVKGVLPRRSNAGKPSQAQERALRKIGNAHIREHRKTVSAWQKETPTFAKLLKKTNYTITLTVMLAGDPIGIDKYIWIDLGTKRHDIDAKDGKLLTFGTPYHASTAPRVIGSGRAATGDEIRRVEHVDHPGVEPRLFTQTINENLAAHDKRLIEEAGVKV